MTKLEKKNNSNCEVLGGYLKTLDYKESCKIWWKNLNNNERKLVTTLPNFDKKIFKEITGITIKKSDIE